MQITATYDMPKMRPLPISTAGLKPFRRGWNWLTKPRKWEICEDWFYRPFGKPLIIIPAPFIFDGASIPRPFWPLLSPVGILLIPAIVHDFGYKHNHLYTHTAHGGTVPLWAERDRKFWDQLFRAMSIEVNGIKTVSEIAYRAVRLGGGPTWNKHRAEEVRNGLKAAEAKLREPGCPKCGHQGGPEVERQHHPTALTRLCTHCGRMESLDEPKPEAPT